MVVKFVLPVLWGCIFLEWTLLVREPCPSKWSFRFLTSISRSSNYQKHIIHELVCLVKNGVEEGDVVVIGGSRFLVVVRWGVATESGVKAEEMKGTVVWFERVEAKGGNHRCVVLFTEGMWITAEGKGEFGGRRKHDELWRSGNEKLKRKLFCLFLMG